MQTNASGTLVATASYLIGRGGPKYRCDDTTPTATPSWYVTAGKKYDVYSAARLSTGTSTTKQGFVGGLGHQTDSESGLIYMQARYYDPVIGRFVSEAPEYDGANWYVYCDDDPVDEVDSSGKAPLLDTDLIYEIEQYLTCTSDNPELAPYFPQQLKAES